MIGAPTPRYRDVTVGVKDNPLLSFSPSVGGKAGDDATPDGDVRIERSQARSSVMSW